MKKILIYTEKNGNFIDSLYHSLGDGFKEIGKEVVYCHVNNHDFKGHLLSIIKNEDIDFSIGHNEFGIIHIDEYKFLKEFYKSHKHVAILDDTPYNKVTNKTFDANCPNLLIAYRDRSHLDYLKSIKLKHKALDYFFLPFCALINKREEISTNKDIDVIFSGMYYGEAERSWHNLEISKPVRAFLDLAANMLEKNAITVDNAISHIITNYELKINGEELKPIYKTLYQHCKLYRRNRLVSAIANSHIRLTVCSDSWRKSRLADKLAYETGNNTKDIFNLYKRSKILLQDMAEFNDGSHCRIGDGPLCNAMVVSEYSKFIKENFNNSGIYFFNWNNLENLPKSISIFVSKDKLRNSYVDSACKEVHEKFLPKHGAMKILNAVNAPGNG